MKLEVAVRDWVQQTLRKQQAFLSNMPVCPYAQEALDHQQVKIVETDLEGIFSQTLREMDQFSSESQRMTVIGAFGGAGLPLSEVQKFVSGCREDWYSRDLWLMYDHPGNPEEVSGFAMNHGEILLFMVQRLSELVRASEVLQKQGYYDQWPADYFERVVGRRQKYFERYLEGNQKETTL